jgi:hypothetical protein
MFKYLSTLFTPTGDLEQLEEDFVDVAKDESMIASDDAQLISEPGFKSPVAQGGIKSPVQIRLEKQKEEADNKTTNMNDIQAALEAAHANKQALLDKKGQSLKERHNIIKEKNQSSKKEEQESALQASREVEKKLSDAEAKRAREEEQALERVKAHNAKIAEAQRKKEELEDKEREQREKTMADRLAEAEARRAKDEEAMLLKVKSMNDRAAEAARKRNEMDALANKKAEEAKAKFEEAEAKRRSEEEASLEKIKSHNNKVAEALKRKEENTYLASQQAAEIHARLGEAEAKRKLGEEASLEKVKAHNQKVAEVLSKKDSMDLSPAKQAALQARLDEAEAKRKMGEEASMEKLKAHSEKVAEALKKKEEMDMMVAKKAEEKKAKIEEAEAKRKSGEEASLEKVKAHNDKVAEAQRLKEEQDAAAAQKAASAVQERLSEAEARYAKDTEEKIEKVKSKNSHVSEVLANRRSMEAVEKDALERASSDKIANADARRSQLQDEKEARVAVDMAKVKGVQMTVKAKQHAEMTEKEEELRARLSAAEERHNDAVNEIKEKGAAVGRHSAETKQALLDKEQRMREELKSAINNKLAEAETRRKALGSPTKANISINSQNTSPQTLNTSAPIVGSQAAPADVL